MAGDSNSNTFGPPLFVDAELSNAAAAAAAAAADDDDDDDDDHKRSYLVYLRLTVKQLVNPIEVHFGWP